MINIRELGPETRIKKNSKQLIANVTNSAIYPIQQANHKVNQIFGYKTGVNSQQNHPAIDNRGRYQVSMTENINRNSVQKVKDKQRYSNVQSQFLADTSRMRQQTDRYTTDRLNTDQIIPSFRQKYQIYQLLQEISEHKRIIDMKNKQIFYLSNQIVSIKDQFTQKIIHLEDVISQNKRQLTELRYSGLKSKRLESQRGDKTLDQFKKNYELQIFNLKQANQQIIRKNHEQHKKQIQNMEQKLGAILKLEKRQKNSIQQLFNQKAQNYQTLIKQLQIDVAALRKQKQQIYQQNNKQQIALDTLKQEFKIFGERASNDEKLLKIQIQNLKSQIITYQNSNTELKKNLKKNQQQFNRQLHELQQTSQIYKSQSLKLKSILLSKDKQIAKLIDQNNRAQKFKRSQQRSLDPVRACSHNGLIQQLEKNIEIKNKENQQLRNQLIEWGKYIGFEKSSYDKTSDLLNASSEALQAQQNFSNSLRKRINKLSK